MTNEAIYKILDMPDFCNKNRISRDDGTRFGFGWALKIVNFFRGDHAAQSMVFPATVYLEGRMYDGEVEVYRNGHHAVRLHHGA